MNSLTQTSNHASINNLAAINTVVQSTASLHVFQIASPVSTSPIIPMIAGSNVYRTAKTNIIPLASPGNNCPNSLLKSESKEPRNIKQGARIVIVRKSGPKKMDSNAGSSLTWRTVSHQKTAYPANIPPTVFAFL